MKHKSNKLIVLIGTSLSGKTTWANDYAKKNPGTFIVSRDIERKALINDANLPQPLIGRFEETITRIVFEKVDNYLLLGNVILDNTNLLSGELQILIERYKHRFDIIFHEFEPKPMDKLVWDNYKRWKNTGVEIPLSVLENQIKQYESLKSVGIPQNNITTLEKTDRRLLMSRYNDIYDDTDLPLCVITDLDGTLSLMNGRDPFKGEDCSTDRINASVYSVLRMIETQNSMSDLDNIEGNKIDIFIFSGRNSDNGSREATENWLSQTCRFLNFGKNYERLIMRQPGDMRSDVQVKREMFKQHIEGKYKVLFVLDDRPQVIRYWDKLGLDVFDVHPASGEF